MLAISGLGYRYPDAQEAALDDITFTARSGSILGLLGPNGAGKTTLISHLAGLRPIQQGRIDIDGCPLAEARRTDPTRIALAPQEYAFYPMLSVRENLQVFAAASRILGHASAAAVDRSIAFAQLERHAVMRAEKLSGGLKRRLNLAIALLAKPSLILLDEPTAGVDPQSRAFLLDAVRALAAEGTTVIYTSHYMEEIETIADDVAILDRGRLLRHDSLSVLLAEGARHFEMRVAAPVPPGLLARFGTVAGEAEHGIREGRIALDLFDGVLPESVLAAMTTAGVHVLDASFGRYNLEQLFMRLTQRSLRDD